MTIEELFEKVDRAISRWEETRRYHNLTDEIVEEGKQIIAEEKNKRMENK